MKTIKLIDTETVKGRDVLKMCMENAQQQGANIDSIRRRCKVLDRLEAANDSAEVIMEDAEFEFMKSTINAFTFGEANNDLLMVLDSLLTPVPEEMVK